MTWLSFVLVAILFFMPGINLAKIILDNVPPLVISLPFLPVSASIPINNFVWLGFSTALGWLFVFLLLVGVQRYFRLDILTKLSLRNGMLFARVPEIGRTLPIIIASIALLLFVLRVIVLLIIQSLVINVHPTLSLLLKFPNGENILILSIFTLIAEAVYKKESNWQYKLLVLRNRKYRKEKQKAIVIRG